ncbi:hypothetical protein LINPERHAP1_LOCUS14521, partial [Linum perenne]
MSTDGKGGRQAPLPGFEAQRWRCSEEGEQSDGRPKNLLVDFNAAARLSYEGGGRLKQKPLPKF